MVRILISFLAILLVGALIYFSVIFFAINNFKAYDSSITVDKDACLLSSDEDSIKILQITDLQTKNIFECAMAYPTVKRLVDENEPDLIVLTGDNVSNGANREVVSTLINLLDSFEIPWALVLGNHDHSDYVSEDEMSKMFEESKYGIFKTGSIANKHGNYYYNVALGGEIVRTLIFMDDSDHILSEEQVAWYGDIINNTAEQEGKIIPSLVFFHIPVPEVIDAHRLYEQDPSIGSGVMGEESSALENDGGFFELVKKLGSTEALLCGHDHLNDTILNYQGIILAYGRKTGYTVTYDPERVGANVITITADGFEIERVR